MQTLIICLLDSGPYWTDVVQAISSFIALAAIFLVLKTLSLQQKTLSEQQKLTELEQRRFKIEIMPDINIEVDWQSKSLTFTPLNFDLINAKFEILESHPSLEDRNIPFFQNDRVRFPRNLSFSLYFEWDSGLIQGTEIMVISGTYEDSIGNKYAVFFTIQSLVYPIKQGPLELQNFAN